MAETERSLPSDVAGSGLVLEVLEKGGGLQGEEGGRGGGEIIGAGEQVAFGQSEMKLRAVMNVMNLTQSRNLGEHAQEPRWGWGGRFADKERKEKGKGRVGGGGDQNTGAR